MRVLASCKEEIPGLTADMDVFMVRCLHGHPVLYEFEVHYIDSAATPALDRDVHSRPLSGAYIHSDDAGLALALDKQVDRRNNELLDLLGPVWVGRLVEAFHALQTVAEGEVVISTIKGEPMSVRTHLVD